MKIFDHEKEKWLAKMKTKCQTFRKNLIRKGENPKDIDQFLKLTITNLWNDLIKLRKPKKEDIVLVDTLFDRNVGEAFYAATLIKKITKGKLSEILIKISQLVLFQRPVIIGIAAKSDRADHILNVMDNAGLIAVEII